MNQAVFYLFRPKYSLVLLVFACLLMPAQVPAAAPGYAKVGSPAPVFTLPSLKGPAMSLEDCRGSVIVVHFGASWCPFCRAEDPHLEALYQEYKARGVKVLVVNVSESKRKAKKWMSRAGFSFPMLLDEDGKVASSYMPPDKLPDLDRDEAMVASNLVIDKNGIIRYFSLLDTTAFDARLIQLKKTLDDVLKESCCD